nr:MAG TPA: hypothetical protein [Caudoviricetes sp.]
MIHFVFFLSKKFLLRLLSSIYYIIYFKLIQFSCPKLK